MTTFRLESIDWDQSGGGTPHAIDELARQLPADDFDWTRTQSEFRRNDDQGPFLLIYAVVVVALFSGRQLHAGMRSLPIRVAYVVDNTLGTDERLDFGKCDYIGQGLLTDVTQSPGV